MEMENDICSYDMTELLRQNFRFLLKPISMIPAPRFAPVPLQCFNQQSEKSGLSFQATT